VTRAFLLWALVGASAALSACDLPPATFDGLPAGGSGAATSTTVGGTGGDMAGSTSTTGATHTGGSGGGAGGNGGMGGAATTTSTTTSTSTTTGSGGMGPVLQCNYPTPASYCQPGQVCCLDKESPFEDSCAEIGGCNPAEYGEAKCSSDAHCPNGKHCCLFIVPNGADPTKFDAQSVYCDTECSLGNDELKACEDTSECLDSFPYVECKAALGYASYKFCQAPEL
jgi:hypothetical protein